MSVTYGFYNSVGKDRVYNATQMSQLFDGLIKDGVFASIGTSFVVTPGSNGMSVNIGIGRAWFNHTWTYNDTIMPLTVDASEPTLNRIDAVVIEVDSSTRVNKIKMVKGSPTTNPSNPAMTNTTTLHQHPIAYVYVGAAVAGILAKNITNVVGTSECPYVSGIIDTITIDGTTNLLTAEFEEWFATIQNKLSGDVAGKLQNEIDAVDNRVDTTNSTVSALSSKVDTQAGKIGLVKNSKSNLMPYQMIAPIYIGGQHHNTFTQFNRFTPDRTKLVSSDGVTIRVLDTATGNILASASPGGHNGIVALNDYVLAIGPATTYVLAMTNSSLTLASSSSLTISQLPGAYNSNFFGEVEDPNYALFCAYDGSYNNLYAFYKASKTVSMVLSSYGGMTVVKGIQYGATYYRLYGKSSGNDTLYIRLYKDTLTATGLSSKEIKNWYASSSVQATPDAAYYRLTIDPVTKELRFIFYIAPLISSSQRQYTFHYVRVNLTNDTIISDSVVYSSTNAPVFSMDCLWLDGFYVGDGYNLWVANYVTGLRNNMISAPVFQPNTLAYDKTGKLSGSSTQICSGLRIGVFDLCINASDIYSPFEGLYLETGGVQA